MRLRARFFSFGGRSVFFRKLRNLFSFLFHQRAIVGRKGLKISEERGRSESNYGEEIIEDDLMYVAYFEISRVYQQRVQGEREMISIYTFAAETLRYCVLYRWGRKKIDISGWDVGWETTISPQSDSVSLYSLLIHVYIYIYISTLKFAHIGGLNLRLRRSVCNTL